MSAAEKKVLIVGGGLAGLACALRLHETGARPLIFEGSDGVGGRVRTDHLDGFLLDRGFQVFLDAYPEAGELLDKESLDLRAFRPGALMHKTSGMRRVMDVFREPRHLMESALAPVGSFADKLRVARLRWRLTRLTTEEIAGHEDMTTESYLQRAGFSASMIDGFFRSFYGGIFLERELQTSSRMFEFTFKMFSQGSATLPARGMGEIPRQLASRLPPGAIRLGAQVTQIQPGSITLESGEQFHGDAVVVATDATTAAGLVSAGGTVGPVWRSVTCLYFAAARSPLDESIIALNGTGSGLVNNVCVPSDLAPEYAPRGQALVSVSVRGTVDPDDLESRVLAELEAWFGGAVREWRHLRTYRIGRALPRQSPGTGFTGPGFRKEAGVYLCGDHIWSASIEGAIISGLRTADAILKPS
ncbi:MAG: FAD-dependent oxidoreductase [Verrucomicrobiae bacterium]|nr:FAD-dependent oxidoreductase [Verrucomicrobiae bacterium]